MSDGSVGEVSSGEPASGGLPFGPAWLRENAMQAVGVLLAAALAFAYLPLLSYDPEASRHTVGGAEGFLFEPTGGSPQLIFLVTAWMLWNRRSMLAATLGEPASLASPAAIVTGAGLAVWGIYTGATDLLIPSMSLLLLGGAGLVGGSAGIRAIRLPALFLLFAIPLPAATVNAIIWPLQLFTVDACLLLLGLFGIDSKHAGDMIYTSGKVFHVIETCGGLRVMITLTFSAVIYAELFRRSRLQMFLLMILAPFLGAVVNVARVMTIIFNPYSDLSSVHTAQGVAMVVIAVLLLSGLDRLLRIPLGERADAPLRYRAPTRPGGVARSYGRVASLAVVLAAIGTVPAWITPWQPAPAILRSIYSVPPTIGDWSAIALPVDEPFLGSVAFTERVARVYTRGEDYVDVFLGLNRRFEREGSMLSKKTMLPSSGWDTLERGRLELAPDGRPADWAILGSGKKRALVVHWYEGTASVAVESTRQLFALDHSPVRRPGHALIVRATTNLADEPDGRENAFARIEEFVPLIRRELERI